MKPKILFSQLPTSGWWKSGTPKHENNWAMEIGRIPDQELVVKEHSSVYEALQEHTQLEMMEFPQHLDNPQTQRHDAIFTRDSFISNQKGTVVISNFKDPQRKEEAMAIEDYIVTKGFSKHTLSETAYAEGGEFYYSPKEDILFAGSSRNTLEGVKQTAKLLQIKTVCIVQSNTFHLDTIFTILLNEKGQLAGVISCMDLVKNKKQVKTFLQKYYIPLIEIDPIDTINFDGSGKISVNCLAIPGKLIGGSIFHTQGVEEKIKALGVQHIITPITQFLYSGGGVHCLTNELYAEPN